MLSVTPGPGTDLEKQPPSEAVQDDQKTEDSVHDEVEDVDPNVVDWDGPNDPINPLNWTSFQKGIAIFIASAVTFVTPFASSVFAPGVPQLLEEFKTTDELLSTFVVSIYLLGFTIGPFLIAPASEIWGRLPTYHVGNVVFLIFTIACAVSTNIGMFCAFRLFQGMAGATPLTNGGATIGDLIEPSQRGVYMAIWGIGPLLGPSVGPVVGGFLSQALGWRWTFWLLTIISGVLTISGFIFLRETYAPVVLEKKTRKLRKETGNEKLRSKLDSGLPKKKFFIRAIVRPMKMLTMSPIVFLLSLMASVSFSYIYLLFSTFTFVFEGEYGFTPGESGLTFLGIGLGLIIALPVAGKGSDVISTRMTVKHGGEAKPEYRLPILIAGPWLIAAGLFGYGWTAQEHVHFLAPVFLSIPIGMGQICTFMPVQNYLVDAFGLYAASAIGANTILRSLFGALIPLAAQPMYNRLGLGWGNSLLAFIALATIPVPFIFVKYGERMRIRFARDW